MHCLQTLVTALQVIMCISQLYAFLCVSARVARPSFRVLVMQYIQHCGGSGLVHETRAQCDQLLMRY